MRPVYFRLLSALLAVLCATPVVDAGKKDHINRRRQETYEESRERFQDEKRVSLNVHYRVPVIETLGFLAANEEDTDKLLSIVERVRPIADRVRVLSGNTFEGRRFPADVSDELDAMRARLMDTVLVIYGKDTHASLEAYLTQKYDYLTQGLFSPIVE